MSYLLEFCQNERRNLVGLFDSEENGRTFIESIPFVIKESFGSGSFYSIK